MKSSLLLFTVIFSLSLLTYTTSSTSPTFGDGINTLNAMGGIEPPNDAPIGPVGNTGAEYKFDAGFYQKIQDTILEEPHDGDPGVYDGERYYNVVMVVSRDDGDERDPDEVASENKDAIVKRLKLLGARDIASAESLSFVTASIPVADVPGFSLHEEVYGLGDGEQAITFEVDKARQTIHATDNDIQEVVRKSLNGTGVTVAVIDSGINHDSLNTKILKHISCTNTGCKPILTDSRTSQNRVVTHGTQVAQVIAASGLDNDNGIAPGVKLLDVLFVRNNTPIVIPHMHLTGHLKMEPI